MPCTTLLVGKNATNSNSTMISRTDDGHFDEKKIVVVNPKDQKKIYKSKISHLTITLPDNPLRYTACPSIDQKNGIWAATGINSLNVGMTATETITSNARVYAADPLVSYKPKNGKNKEVPGGIGEEDIVVIVLPYIKSARDGVIRLGKLLEEYGTYENNGIAFNDEKEIWWLESIGGHHWIAKKVNNDNYVVMPNQFGLDNFDFDDAYGKMEENMCSKDLKEFVIKNKLCREEELKNFNPRLAFGSHDDSDHSYNTPRAWYMLRYFNPSMSWDGDNAMYKPESDSLPWTLKPEHFIAIEDVKYILSSYYQGTPYNPYGRGSDARKGMYRPIGISRTGVTSICEIRSDVPEEIKGLEWICFGSNAFNVMIPLYTNVSKMPKYVSTTTLDVDSNTFYWATRLIGVMADNNYSSTQIFIERYQKEVMNETRLLLKKYDEEFMKTHDINLLEKANQALCDKVEKITQKILNKILLVSSENMKNGYHRFDN